MGGVMTVTHIDESLNRGWTGRDGRMNRQTDRGWTGRDRRIYKHTDKGTDSNASIIGFHFNP